MGTKKVYEGINFFNLLLAQMDEGFKSPYWITFNQCRTMGGNIKKGSKGEMIVYWNFIMKKVENGVNENGEKNYDTQKIPYLKYFTVFNLDQTENIPEKKLPEDAFNMVPTVEFNSIQACENIVNNYKDGPEIEYKGTIAAYSPSRDKVIIPEKVRFINPENMYSAIFHELTHSTGHKSRLSRPGIVTMGAKGGHEYSKEELVAEVGAAYLCFETGISPETFDNSSAYIACWLAKLKSEKKWLVSAFGQAFKAVNHIKGIEVMAKENKVA
jgi:antirestriction protein ArdC